MSPKDYPAAVGHVAQLVIALLVAFHVLTGDTGHAVLVALVALVSLVVAFMVHPFIVGAATGAFQTFIVALGAFGFHLTADKLSAVVAIATVVFGFIATHVLSTPKANPRVAADGRPA